MTPSCMAIIPAKGTSRRIPRKNFQPCAGRTLVQRAVDCAIESGIFQTVIVSSEDWEAWDGRCEFDLRDSKLSADGVSVTAVVFDLLCRRQFRNNSFCVLWPTSPLRLPRHLREMWECFKLGEMKSLHSVDQNEQHDGTAVFMRTQEFLRRLSLDYRRGDPCLDYRRGDPCFVMVPEFVCDVNTPEDLAEAERRLLAREAQCQSS